MKFKFTIDDIKGNVTNSADYSIKKLLDKLPHGHLLSTRDIEEALDISEASVLRFKSHKDYWLKLRPPYNLLWGSRKTIASLRRKLETPNAQNSRSSETD